MIAFKAGRIALILNGLGLILIHPLPTVRADAMQPWDGATATASSDVNGTRTGQSETDPKAYARDGWSYSTPSYLQSSDYASAGGYSTASASGPAGTLLQVSTQTNIFDHSTYPINPDAPVGAGSSSASASWLGDSVLITPPPGSPMPDSIRLQFGLTFNPPIYTDPSSPTDGNYRTVQVSANNTTITINPADKDHPGKDLAHSSYSGFDSVSDTPAGRVGTFHLDLPVNQAGTSIPLNLFLEATSYAETTINHSASSFHDDVLGLTDVTFADGTSLASKGYGVTFASGLILSPQPVPEPTSIAVWSVVAIAGAWAARRKSRA